MHEDKKTKGSRTLKIAIVHDFLNQLGGAERILECIHEIFPDAPIYTLIYDPDNGEQITFINGKKVERTTCYTYKPPTLSKVYKVDGKEVRKQVPHPKAEEIIKRLPNYNPEEYGKDKDH